MKTSKGTLMSGKVAEIIPMAFPHAMTKEDKMAMAVEVSEKSAGLPQKFWHGGVWYTVSVTSVTEEFVDLPDPEFDLGPVPVPYSYD